MAKMADLIAQKQAESVEDAEMSGMLEELESLSDEEAENLLKN